MWRAVLLMSAGCGRLGFETSMVADADTVDDSPLGAWSAPVLAVSSPTDLLDDPSLTADELEMYVNADTVLRVVRRESRDDPWGPLEIPPGAISDGITQPFVSADGLTMYMTDFTDIVVSTRADRTSAWPAAEFIPELNTPLSGSDAAPRPDQLELALSDFTDQDRLTILRRASVDDVWGTMEPIASISIPAAEASFGEAGLALYFGSFQNGDLDLYRVARTALDQPFGPPEAITELNSLAEDSDPWVSEDGRTIYFTSRRSGNREIWMSTR